MTDEQKRQLQLLYDLKGASIVLSPEQTELLQEVEYDGQLYKLSPFVVKFLPDDLRNRKNAYQGPKYFTYQGQRLDDLRPDTPKKNDEYLFP